MKLKELKMYPAPISDSIFLGTMKKDKSGFNMWSNKIDFTEQFWNCLAEICRKKLIESENNSVVFLEEFESGLKLEIKVSI
ncbi:hypothetical protein JJB27_08270 [Campylobacter fetus subsp. venerealis]|uniref:DUF7446 family protein n=1 Tax=Campylobacter TaxID=194 RepID=UPI00080B8E14|nr:MULTISPECIES: hypothetical protein [Campylobacter]OCS21602.1 hypothetical protein CFVI97532_08800 [Campylobacter fetus subsp. venerealis cfvi97/532]KAA3685289.1 hypothetical protein E3U42_09445 [Campylobacter fetus subsp. fetus]KAA3686020.1 hypothetical protein E3U40_02400 [Campylobacter fetus subsp. venerealis]MBK3499059.1 hypothetical protein [Campylobacter fetus subsp. venerealis]MBK3503018.1 hypothetical protein [Campylobacter fetus subsp. venerealis]